MPTRYVCVYCGGVKPSYNGTGSDVSCCGEVGHSVLQTIEQHYCGFPRRLDCACWLLGTLAAAGDA